MVILVTYLPFYRIHEVNEYFINNIKIIEPNHAIVFIDNIFEERQKKLIYKVLPKDIEYVFGNWGSRIMTWLFSLKHLYDICNGDVIFVDSDNVVSEDFMKYHNLLCSYDIGYGILDYEAWSYEAKHLLIRSIPINNNQGIPIFKYRVYDRRYYFRGGPIFFWGPKQVVYLRRLPDRELIDKVYKGFINIVPWIRNLVSDETLLGLLAWLSGIEYIPWTIASHHFHHGSGQSANKCLIAMAHAQFAKGLWHEFKKKEFLLYYLKYKTIMLKNCL